MKGAVIAGKTILYFLRAAAIIAAVAGLLWLSFYTSTNIANMYIITTEGLKQRADAVIYGASDSSLIEYFTPQFLDEDTLLLSGKYADYSIKNYEYKLKLEWIFTLPWRDKGTVRLTERVLTMSGEILKEKLPEAGVAASLPEWDDYRYEITLTKTKQGRWYISKMEKLAKLAPLELSAAPAASPTPSQ